MTENTPRRYQEDLDLDSQFNGGSLRAPEPETYADPDPIHEEAPRAAPQRPAPRDHVQASAAPRSVMDEATGILMVVIEFDEMELSIPADPEDWPIKATMSFEDGKIINAIKALLSPGDFAKVLGKNYRNKEFGKLYEKLAQAGGFENSGN